MRNIQHGNRTINRDHMPTEESRTSAKRKISGFAGDVLKLVSGTAFAQLIGLLAAPVLTRLYVPEAYGIVALFAAITGIFGVIACMRYELAIMLPERDEEAANLLGVCLGFTLLISLLLAPLVWWGRAPLLRGLNAPALESYLWLAPFGVFISGVFQALNYWNSRTKHFGRLSIAGVTSSLTTTSLNLGLGFAGHATAGSMIVSGIAGQAVATSVLGSQIRGDDRNLFFKSIRWRAMWEEIKRYKKFPLYDSWASLMNVISGQLPPLLLASFFSSTVVGFYALGYRLLTMPATLIGGAISQVFFQHAAVAKNNGTLIRVVRNTFTRLVALGLFPILLVMITGKDIFSVVFGSQWAEAGVYAQILAPWVLLNFVSSPISTIFSILEMQGRFLLFNSVLLGTRVVSLVIGGLLNSILISLMLFSITGAIMYFYFCLFILKKAGLTMKMLTNETLRLIAIAIITLLPVIVLKGYGIQSLAVVITGCISALLYYTILYSCDKELQQLIANYIGLTAQRKGKKIER